MSLVQHAPRFSASSAAELARSCFGIEGTVEALPSERDQNFQVRTPGGEAYVLKIANANEAYAMLEAQNAAMAHIATHSTAALSSRVVPARDGATIVEAEGPDGRRHLVRLLTYLPGTPLARVNPHTPALMAGVGRFMGELDAALSGFDHPALHRDFHWDVANAGKVVRQHIEEIAQPARRSRVTELLSRFEAHTEPTLGRLRKGIIHGDANDYNLLAGGGSDLLSFNQQIAGILDFGDMVHSCIACDVAIAAAYALLDKPDPLSVVAQVVEGFHAVYPLDEVEVEAIWDLVCMRLCMSVCHAAHQRRLEPGNEYLSISERPAWEALARLGVVHPRLARYTLRAACGLPPVPAAAGIVRWLADQAATAAPVIDADLRHDPVHVLDLSVGSQLLTSALLAGDNTTALSAALFAGIGAAGARVGIGRYDEARPIYTGSAFALDGSLTGERRTVHLGLDLFAAAETPVYAPLAGTVHAFADNAARHDYGPTIVLRHATDDGTPFYTLYGHLTHASIDGLQVGQQFAAGDRIASIGAPPINGDWPPHLHLQIIADLLELDCDFPGVAAPSQRQVYTGLSPDPNILLGIPAGRFPVPPPAPEATLAERKARIGYNLSISYRKPLKIVRGLGVHLYDENGRPYLDCVNNVAHVGHCHPHVVAAGQRQMAVLNTNTRYLHDSINRYAERLCATLPEPLRVCFFVNSGSEANDLALRLARAATGAVDVITLDVAYHGHTQALIEVSPYKHDGPGGKGRPSYVQKVVMPDPYRGPYRSYDAVAGIAYAMHVAEAVDAIHAQNRGVAAFICEALMGCGGQIVFPNGYMDAAFHTVRRAGGICIADEVQTGFGRVGSHFWGFETQGVVPDIVTMGKPAGNGHPLAAVVTTPEIAAKFANGMEYFNTFGGNAVSCDIGMAVLDVIEREHLQQNALEVGNYLMARLWELMSEHPLIGDVRGLGLYIGVELVTDREARTPAGEQASYIANRMRDYGVLISTDGPDHNVLKIKPPIVFSRRNADHLVDMLARVAQADCLRYGSRR
jgi:4-aminobutyrate aminotransferase-like enzyme/Ser/Thr protein kinase RdoA (MazF antagonist)